jgi:hypothetical protein
MWRIASYFQPVNPSASSFSQIVSQDEEMEDEERHLEKWQITADVEPDRQSFQITDWWRQRFIPNVLFEKHEQKSIALNIPNCVFRWIWDTLMEVFIFFHFMIKIGVILVYFLLPNPHKTETIIFRTVRKMFWIPKSRPNTQEGIYL